MKKVFITVLFLATVHICNGQYNERPTKSRFFNSKHFTFQLKPGDILVYIVRDNNGDQKDLLVSIKQVSNSITYGYILTGGKEQLNVVDKNSLASNTNYTFDAFTGPTPGNLWLSKKNWRDLASKDKLTVMNVGSVQEIFTRSDAKTIKINYKGKDKIITVYNISSGLNAGQKQLQVLTDERNPLIVSLNMGHTMLLKEVR